METFKIWMDQLDEGIISFGSTTFTLITTCEAKDGSAASLLRSGANDADRKGALTFTAHRCRRI